MNDLRDGLVRLCTEIAYLESVVFNYEDRFFEHCGINPSNTLGLEHVSFSSEDVKFVWTHYEGQSIASCTTWESFYKFMESLNGNC